MKLPKTVLFKQPISILLIHRATAAMADFSQVFPLILDWKGAHLEHARCTLPQKLVPRHRLHCVAVHHCCPCQDEQRLVSMVSTHSLLPLWARRLCRCDPWACYYITTTSAHTLKSRGLYVVWRCGKDVKQDADRVFNGGLILSKSEFKKTMLIGV